MVIHHEGSGAAESQPNEKEFFTTKDTKGTKFGDLVIRTLRVLRAFVVSYSG